MTKSLTYAMHEVIALMDKQADYLLTTNFNISYSWFLLMVVLLSAGPINQHRLATNIGHSDPAISRLIPKIVAAGLISSRVSPDHKRNNIIELTPKGQTVALQAAKMLEGAFVEKLARANIDMATYAGITFKIQATLKEVPGERAN